MMHIENRKQECSKCGEANDRLPQRYCLKCHAEQIKLWRKMNPLNDEQKKKANARNYPKIYVKRGKLTKSPCMVCGDQKVHAHHLDYTQPLNVRWLCAKDHQELHNFIRTV